VSPALTTAAHRAGPFALLLQHYRALAGLSQEELAERAELSRRGISDLERGVRRSPYPATVRRLAEALGLDPAQRLGLLASARAAASLDAHLRLAPTLEPEAPRGERQLPPMAGSEGGARTASRHNLPTQLTSFVGRGRDITQVEQLVRNARLVTLSGPGGVGKTRLAIEVARLASAEFADGSAFVDLTATRQPRLVLALIAQALHVPDTGGGGLQQVLIDAIAERSLLLLLDNCEHVIEAASDVAALMRACAGLHVLATSREPLRVQGERVYDVLPLALPSYSELHNLEQVGRVPAVELFVERAEAVNAGFRLDATTAPAVAELCRRLDGLPLAIELAASRVKLLPPLAMLARLERRLPLPTGGARDLPARQQTLWDTMAWSYDLLEAAEQRLFRRLAVFAGGCTLEAAERVCNAEGDLGPDMLNGLAALVDQSLVRRLNGADREPRFAMLDTLREYGLEQLEATREAAAVRRRHASYFLALAETAASEYRGAEAASWLDCLDQERHNLRAALASSPAELGGRLAAALEFYWARRGHLSEGRGWLERMLTANAAAPAGVRAGLLNHAASLARLQGDAIQAATYAEHGLALSRERSDTVGAAWSLSTLGLIARDAGDWVLADTRFDEALGLYRAAGCATYVASVLTNQGITAERQGDDARAQALLEESLALKTELGGNQWSIAVTLSALGRVAQVRGDAARAAALFAEGLALTWELRLPREAAWCLEGLASLAVAQGQLERATRLFGAVEMLRDTTGIAIPVADQTTQAHDVAPLRAMFGEQAFASAWAEGQEMTLDQACAYALADVRSGEATPDAAGCQAAARGEATTDDPDETAFMDSRLRVEPSTIGRRGSSEWC
jgi:predicted ATPase/transcriptional regulator with XRE-family HTH domain